MTAIALLALAWLIAAGIGRTLLARFSCLSKYPLERFVFASALGLGLAAYGMYALGMAGLLSFGPITCWWLLLGGIGARGIWQNLRDLKNGIARNRSDGDAPALNPPNANRLLAGFALTMLLLVVLLAVVGCFQPPNVHAWDALAYHLADPKLFLMQHRIVALPTEHHSNFPFSMEMLFTAGLLYQGYALANLFHLLTAVLTTLAVFAFCRRVLSVQAAYIAALLFATTPLVFWESTVAYTDIGLTLYASLSAFAALSVLPVSRSVGLEPFFASSDVSQKPETEAATQQWVWLAGLMMGFALGIKYLAVVPCFGIGLLLVVRCATHRQYWRILAAYLIPAMLIGMGWYVKNTLHMSNPVYPYLFKAFPHSRYWSADRAAAYQGEQLTFGYAPGAQASNTPTPVAPASTVPAHSGSGSTLTNLLLTPWRLIAEPAKYQNAAHYTVTEWISGVYGALGFALVRRRKLTPILTGLLCLILLEMMAWFWTAQVGRYLLLVLPLLAVIGGAATEDERRETRDERQEAGNRTRDQEENHSSLITHHSSLNGKWLFPAAILLLAGQTALLMWALFGLPTGGRDATAAYLSGLAPSALSIPEAWNGLLHPQEAQDSLRRRLDVYNAIEWINANTPKESGVVLYDDVLGFYLDRPYVWGNGEHSSFIGYEMLPDGAALTRRLQSLGIRYALINLNYSPKNNLAGRTSAGLDAGPNGQEEAALAAWYLHSDPDEPAWRKLVADALARGLWQPVAMGGNGETWCDRT